MNVLELTTLGLSEKSPPLSVLQCTLDCTCEEAPMSEYATFLVRLPTDGPRFAADALVRTLRRGLCFAGKITQNISPDCDARASAPQAAHIVRAVPPPEAFACPSQAHVLAPTGRCLAVFLVAKRTKSGASIGAVHKLVRPLHPDAEIECFEDASDASTQTDRAEAQARCIAWTAARFLAHTLQTAGAIGDAGMVQLHRVEDDALTVCGLCVPRLDSSLGSDGFAKGPCVTWVALAARVVRWKPTSRLHAELARCGAERHSPAVVLSHLDARELASEAAVHVLPSLSPGTVVALRSTYAPSHLDKESKRRGMGAWIPSSAKDVIDQAFAGTEHWRPALLGPSSNSSSCPILLATVVLHTKSDDGSMRSVDTVTVPACLLVRGISEQRRRVYNMDDVAVQEGIRVSVDRLASILRPLRGVQVSNARRAFTIAPQWALGGESASTAGPESRKSGRADAPPEQDESLDMQDTMQMEHGQHDWGDGSPCAKWRGSKRQSPADSPDESDAHHRVTEPQPPRLLVATHPRSPRAAAMLDVVESDMPADVPSVELRSALLMPGVRSLLPTSQCTKVLHHPPLKRLRQREVMDVAIRKKADPPSAPSMGQKLRAPALGSKRPMPGLHQGASPLVGALHAGNAPTPSTTALGAGSATRPPALFTPSPSVANAALVRPAAVGDHGPKRLKQPDIEKRLMPPPAPVSSARKPTPQPVGNAATKIIGQHAVALPVAAAASPSQAPRTTTTQTAAAAASAAGKATAELGRPTPSRDPEAPSQQQHASQLPTPPPSTTSNPALVLGKSATRGPATTTVTPAPTPEASTKHVKAGSKASASVRRSSSASSALSSSSSSSSDLGSLSASDTDADSDSDREGDNDAAGGGAAGQKARGVEVHAPCHTSRKRSSSDSDEVRDSDSDDLVALPTRAQGSEAGVASKASSAAVRSTHKPPAPHSQVGVSAEVALAPIPDAASLKRMTLPALKELLKHRGLKLTGKKEELVERLAQAGGR